MSYLVLARKYRPQTFADLVGQEHVTRTLTNAINLNRIAHGYLFTGTRGVGKTTVARIFAKALNCESSDGPTPEPCGRCVSCKEIAAGTSGDVFEIDAASNTGVDDVRELRENVKYLPARGRYKVYIIDEVHMLSKNAFNALLKTLEEPPAHVVFIFATTEPHKIPDTVLSRTQQYEFKMVGQALIRDYLAKLMAAEEAQVASDVLMLVARKAAGSVRDGLSYMDQVLSYGAERPLTEIAEVLGVVDRQALLDISAAVLAGDPVGVLDVLARLSASNWDVKDLLADLLEHFRNLVAAKVARQPAALIDAGEAELAALKAQVKDVTPVALEHLFTLLADAEELILRSGQPRLVLEMTLVRLAEAATVKPLDDLLDELTKLKEIALAGGNISGPSAGATATRTPRAGKVVERPAPSTPSSAPAPEASPAPDAQDDPHGALVAALKAANIHAPAAYLAQGEVERRGNKLILRVAKGYPAKSLERQLSMVQKLADDLFGAGIKIEVETLDIAPKNSAQAKMNEQRQADQERQQMVKETLAHAAVQWTRDLFPEAEVTVRPLNGPAREK
ncbi:MAG TPA: DNA polymerase III subunit gamma/tau [bacterium]|nr:DNA polymerase III subunit gamma/tau [bacterium]